VKKLDDDPRAAYRDMSADRARETEATDWAEGLIEDAVPAPWEKRGPSLRRR